MAFVSYYELHNAGHALFRYFEPRPGGADGWRASSGRAALLRLYKAADESIGRLREEVGPDVDLLVCSPKGFRANTNGERLLPAVLEGLGYQVPRRPSGRLRSIAAARSLIRQFAPRPLRRWIFDRLSPQERTRILERVWIGSVDWKRSRAFAEPEFGGGFVRLNVRGRQANGIVAAGKEFEVLLDEIIDELLALRHGRTGLRACEQIVRCADYDRVHIRTSCPIWLSAGRGGSY